MIFQQHPKQEITRIVTLIGDYCVGCRLPPPQGKSVLRRGRNYKYKSHEAMLLNAPLRGFCDCGIRTFGFPLWPFIVVLATETNQTEKCMTEKWRILFFCLTSFCLMAKR